MDSSSYGSDSGSAQRTRLFGRERPIHAVLGGGKVADVLLWRDTRVSAAILFGSAAIWFLFEVVEYTFVTLFCHIFITTMLVVFIWSAGADFFKWKPPRLPETILEEPAIRDVASTFHKKINDFLSELHYVASGNNPKLFFLILVSLWVISVIGSSVSTLNLLFFGLLCLEILPFLYEKYEDEVDDLASKINGRMKTRYQKFDVEVLGKIPRGPVKEKKIK
ncbi:reticulon-like protein B9 [Olea europaea var. sylvestris]|uniref:reticulon-like protein B9 n=1 Tax=Olea europaea var. sylvestris TaxID=158386 RepID=UPI000C1CD996|nr:reticulon-like protein B9 [Olea europaea var. sylvestris]